MSDHGDDDEENKSISTIPSMMNKPNLYVGVALASVLIATPFILYNYCYSDSSSSSKSTKLSGEGPPLDETLPQSLPYNDQLNQALASLQQSLFKVETKLNETNENVEALRESSNLPKPTEKSMFDFSNLNPFSSKPKEGTSGPPPTLPIPETQPQSPMPDFQTTPEPTQQQIPPTEDQTQNQGLEGRGEEGQGLEGQGLEGQGLEGQGLEEEPLKEEEQPQPPPSKMPIGGRRTRRKKTKQNYSKKLMAKFLAKLSKI